MELHHILFRVKWEFCDKRGEQEPKCCLQTWLPALKIVCKAGHFTEM